MRYFSKRKRLLSILIPTPPGSAHVDPSLLLAEYLLCAGSFTHLLSGAQYRPVLPVRRGGLAPSYPVSGQRGRVASARKGTRDCLWDRGRGGGRGKEQGLFNFEATASRRTGIQDQMPRGCRLAQVPCSAPGGVVTCEPKVSLQGGHLEVPLDVRSRSLPVGRLASAASRGLCAPWTHRFLLPPAAHSRAISIRSATPLLCWAPWSVVESQRFYIPTSTAPFRGVAFRGALWVPCPWFTEINQDPQGQDLGQIKLGRVSEDTFCVGGGLPASLEGRCVDTTQCSVTFLIPGAAAEDHGYVRCFNWRQKL